MDLDTVIIVGGMSFTILLIVLVVFSTSDRQKIRQERLAALSMLRYPKVRTSDGGETVRKKERDTSGILATLNKYAPKRDVLERLLLRTGKNISIGQFIAIMTIVGIFISMLVALMLKLSLISSLLFGSAVGVLGPLMVVRGIAERRLILFLRDFPDAIDLMVRGLRSGLPVSESMLSVAREFDGPIGFEFKSVMENVQFGTDMEKALWNMTEKLPSADVKFFVITLSIQKDTGGNLADTLNNLSNILRSRKQMVLKVKALSSEAKASAMILGSLPFVLFAILSVLSPEYIFQLFEDPRGHVMLGVGGVLIFIGVMIMRKMIKFRM
ncbi:type II secretion system F family protein [Curvivirga aplysinae]|uniref:type II secretion system F family protein n=1 Tax=Curvivirga aplysinae TaxID=2529852 RepID=UPI0012BD5D0F|nr:type II secretion system F family protein [Curvivirga aplysinae]MTI08632.1 type II secretion system F family protein [Curvivirga aplysinae]